MALDLVSLPMIAPRLAGASVLCLGYPDMAVAVGEAQKVLGAKLTVTASHGLEHKGPAVVPETIAAFMAAGAKVVDCVDVKVIRGCERVVDLNVRQEWPRRYEIVLNPGTLEHCFDIATAWFNAWRAVALGGHVLHVAPLNMINHGFWNVCPTVFYDFCVANGGKVVQLVAANRAGRLVPIEPHKRYRLAEEAVVYALIEKREEVAETIPVQWRYR